MATKVINRKDASKYPAADLYFIGRGSMFGNPFVIDRDGNRQQVIEKHKNWLDKWIEEKIEIKINGYSNKTVIENLENLVGKILVCFCKPLDCHGDCLVELVERFFG